MRVAIVGLTDAVTLRGVERYVYEVVKAMALQKSEFEIHLICGKWQTYYFDLSNYGVKISHPKFIRKNKIFRHLYCALFSPFLCTRFDIVHIANTYPLIFKSKNLIVTIHDIAEFFIEDKYSIIQKWYRRASAFLASHCATKILTVSHYSANSISKKLYIPQSKIETIYLGSDHFKIPLHLTTTEILPARYVLYWGVIERSKGLSNLIHAMDLVRVTHPDAQLIVAGRPGNAFNEFSSLIKDRPWIDYRGHASDSDLFLLIKHSSLVAFPSLFEGFGLPAVEAFSLCDNVVASSTTSLGEITKDFATQVDPSSPSSIADGILESIKNPKYFSHEEKNNILRKFNWSNTAESITRVYRGLNS